MSKDNLERAGLRLTLDYQDRIGCVAYVDIVGKNGEETSSYWLKGSKSIPILGNIIKILDKDGIKLTGGRIILEE